MMSDHRRLAQNRFCNDDEASSRSTRRVAKAEVEGSNSLNSTRKIWLKNHPLIQLVSDVA